METFFTHNSEREQTTTASTLLLTPPNTHIVSLCKNRALNQDLLLLKNMLYHLG